MAGKFPVQVQSNRFRQRLSLWERWHRAAMTERASPLPRSAALSQKAALHLPFSSTTPPVKKSPGKIRRFSRGTNYK